MKNLKKQVEYCLQQSSDCRNSDILLTIAVWTKFYQDYLFIEHGTYCIKLLNLFKVPNQDNIKRIRAKFNSEGKYYPTSIEVAKKRKIKEEEWRSHLGYNPELRTI